MPIQTILRQVDINANPPYFGNDNTQYNMGITFYSTVPGILLGFRYYKAPGDNGVHIGRLWDFDTQTELLNVTFTNETSDRWQEQLLQNPYPITAYKYYLASVNLSPVMNYVATPDLFFSDYTNGVLIAPSSVPNNSFTNGSLPNNFPGSAFRQTGYGRDILFSYGGETKLISNLSINHNLKATIKSDIKLKSNNQISHNLTSKLTILKRFVGDLKQTQILKLNLRQPTRLISKLIQSVNTQLKFKNDISLESVLSSNSNINLLIKDEVRLRSSLSVTTIQNGLIKHDSTSIEKNKVVYVPTLLKFKFKSTTKIVSKISIPTDTILNIRSVPKQESIPGHIDVTIGQEYFIDVNFTCD